MSDLVDRSKYIGGSAAAAILGLNEYKTAYDLWLEKTGKADHSYETNHHMRRGNFMESLVIDWIREFKDPSINSNDLDKKYDAGGGHHDQIFVRHPDFEWIGGHPDGIGIVDGAPFLWELKAPTQRGVQKIQRLGLNHRYFYQVQHYLMCTGIERGGVAVWDYDLWKPYILQIDANPALHEYMLEQYQNFWHCVEIEVPPTADLEDPDMAQPIFDDELDELLADYHTAYRMRYDGKDRQDAAKGRILEKLRGHDGVITENYRCVLTRNCGKSNYTRLTVKPEIE